MPTVLKYRNARVVVYTNAHRPAHVHVMDGSSEAVFNLNCPGGPVDLRENFGFSFAALKRLAVFIEAHLTEACAQWRKIHVNY